MAWTTCPTCGASYRNDEDLRECPRCKIPLASTVLATSPADGNGPVLKQPVTRRLLSAGRVFCVTILSAIPVFVGAGFLLGLLQIPVGLPDLEREPWFWPVVGGCAGIGFGILVGTLIVAISPRQKTLEPVITAMTPEGLSGFLDRMGYPHEKRRLPSGDLEYEVKLTREGWTCAVMVSLSPSRTNIWLTIALHELPTDQHFFGPQFLRLLQASWEIAPAFFTCYRMNNILCLMRAVENRALTPVIFRQALDSVVDVCRRMYALWDVPGWMPSVPRLETQKLPRTESHEVYRPNRDIRET